LLRMSDGFVTVAQCVEGLPLGRFVWEVLLCAFLMWFMLGAINETTPLAFSQILSPPQGDLHSIATMFAALALGNFSAVLVGGWAADKHGRIAVVRPALLLTVCCGMVLQSARTLSQAVFARLLLGLFSGALLSVVPALVAELLPNKHRGFYLTIWCSGWPAGALLSVLVGCFAPNLKWHVFYTILMVPALIVYFCLRADMLPESPRYLYLVGRRDEGYNALQDMYEQEDLILPWGAEAVAVTCAPPPPKSEAGSSSSCGSLCRSRSSAPSSPTAVAAWLAVAMFSISAASQSLKVWMPFLLARAAAENPASTLSLLSRVEGLHASPWAGFVLGGLNSASSALAGPGAALNLLRVGSPSHLEPDRYVSLVLAQAYAMQLLGVVCCAYASLWARRRQLVQWSLVATALLTLLTLCAAQRRKAWLCGPLLALQLAAQSCSTNFLLAFAAEHFPTSRRAKVVAGVVFAAQLADFVTPVAGGLLMQRMSTAGALAASSALYVLAWVISFRLPLPETACEASLHDIDDEPRGLEAKSRIRKRDTVGYRTV